MATTTKNNNITTSGKGPSGPFDRPGEAGPFQGVGPLVRSTSGY